MFINFFLELRDAGVPVSIKEYLTLMGAMEKGCADYDIDHFYYLSRAALVKDERNLDKFDRVFGHVFKGLERAEGDMQTELPEEWLRMMAELHLTDEEKAEIEAMGGWEKLMETLRERLAEQEGRHQGGNKWIGTAGRSPYGAYGYNPEGVRIGQHESRHRRAVKVWDKRDFKNFDDAVELGTRNIKVALKRLRRWVREGAYPFSRGSLRGRTVGIFGMGRIGRAIAQRLAAFGLPIAYHNRRPVDDVPYAYHDTLLGLASAVDTLICVAPGGEETSKAINEAVLKALGSNGVFVNIGRGSTVDEAALIRALEDGTIFAAGLDVFEDEPNVPEALLAVENASLLPHVGSASVATRQGMADLVADNLVSWFVKGQPITPVPETASVTR